MLSHAALAIWLMAHHGRVWRRALNQPDRVIAHLHLRRRHMDAFNTGLLTVLVSEGGYVNDSHDPGGATLNGITDTTYQGYRKRKGLHSRPVALADKSEIFDIYHSIWGQSAAAIADKFPGLAVLVFDAEVNAPSSVIKLLQITAKKDVGAKVPSLLEMLEQSGMSDAQLSERFAMARLAWYCGRLSSRYEAGWLARVRRSYQAAKSLIA